MAGGGDAGTSGAGAVPLKSAQMTGLQQHNNKNNNSNNNNNDNNNNNSKNLQTGNVVDKTADLSGDDLMRVVPRKAVMWHYHTAFLVESGW